jgi:hypothetical protein
VRVYLADPFLGTVRMPLYRFLDVWADEPGRGIVLAMEPVDRSWPQRFALELPGGFARRIQAATATLQEQLATCCDGPRAKRSTAFASAPNNGVFSYQPVRSGPRKL